MAIINKTTFEVYELDQRDNDDDYFECDEVIANKRRIRSINEARRGRKGEWVYI